MLLDDAVGHGQSKAGAATLRLGREEWLEDLGQVLLRNPRSRIDEFRQDLVAALRIEVRTHRQHAARIHRVHGVEHQRHEALDQPLGIRWKSGKSGVELALDRQPLEALVVFQEKQCLLDDGVDVGGHLVARFLGTRKIEQAFDDAPAPLYLRVNDMKVLLLSLPLLFR